MRFDVLTLFPEMFEPLKHSIIERASKQNLININLVNIRDFSKDKHKKVDDTPYGGGAGMVLMCEPLVDAIEALKGPKSHVILMCPQGKPYKQSHAYELKNFEHLIIVCGHYEGFDERIRDYVSEEISGYLSHTGNRNVWKRWCNTYRCVKNTEYGDYGRKRTGYSDPGWNFF